MESGSCFFVVTNKSVCPPGATALATGNYYALTPATERGDRLADTVRLQEAERFGIPQTQLRRVCERNRCHRLRQRRIVTDPSPGRQPGSVYSAAVG